MSSFEVKGVTPEELIGELEKYMNQLPDNKYAFQTALKDLDFDVDEEKLKSLGVTVPFKNIDEAEQSLRAGIIRPMAFFEHDETQHQVLAFDPNPIGYSGFMNCVTHSLAITNHGLFEVGRYPAINLSTSHRNWSWFLHRRLANPEQVKTWREENNSSHAQLLGELYDALTSKPMDS